MVSALTSAARHGVLIKGGEYLEALGAVRALAIDKTGTLTLGQLAVFDFQVKGCDRHRLLALIAGLEARSEHPVARAILRYANHSGVARANRVESFRAIPGRGVEGVVDGVTLTVGSAEHVPDAAGDGWGEPEPGTLRVYIHTEDGCGGLLVLRDEIRPAARTTVDRLHRLGIRPVVMLTGDTEAGAAFDRSSYRS